MGTSSDSLGKEEKSMSVDVMPAGAAVEDKLENGLHRGLKPRHISMLSLGGIIGTGLFLGSGNALVNGGPLGLWMGYSFFGLIVICLMQGLGEMAAYMPLPGGHLMYASRFVDPALGFALNWMYSVVWMLVHPAELVAVAALMNYWVSPDTVNNAVWVAIAWIVVVILNQFPSGVYGEVEFIFSSIKILTIIGLIICGIAINCGAGPDGQYLGFTFWKNPGVFNQYKGIPGAKGQFLGFWAVLTQAAFSYLGSEIVAVVAAEAKSPTTSIPRSIKQVYARISVFYILGTFVIGITCPSNDPRLGTTSDASASPWVIAISRAGIKVLPHIINGCLISSAWSCANANIFVSARSLYSLARQGWLPKIFLKTAKNGTPYYCSALASASGLLAFMCVNSNANRVFNWFVNLVAVGGLMTYIGICLTYIRFRQGADYHKIDRETLPFRSGFARAGAWIGLCTIPVIVFFSGWNVFLARKKGEKFDHATLITNYLPMLFVPFLYVGYKLKYKTKILGYEDMDFHTGARIKGDILEEVRVGPPENVFMRSLRAAIL